MRISKKRLCGFLALAGILFLVQQRTWLVIAASSSLPWKVYLVVKGYPWHKGDIVAIQGHTSPYIQGTPLLVKRVKEVVRGFVRSRGEPVHSTKTKPRHLHNSQGQPLHPVENLTIYPGLVYVEGDDPRSFDSRYQEFGLVKVEHIIGRTFPLW